MQTNLPTDEFLHPEIVYRLPSINFTPILIYFKTTKTSDYKLSLANDKRGEKK